MLLMASVRLLEYRSQAVGWKIRSTENIPSPGIGGSHRESPRSNGPRCLCGHCSEDGSAVAAFTLYSIDALGHRFWSYHSRSLRMWLKPMWKSTGSRPQCLRRQIVCLEVSPAHSERRRWSFSPTWLRLRKRPPQNHSFCTKTERLQARLRTGWACGCVSCGTAADGDSSRGGHPFG